MEAKFKVGDRVKAIKKDSPFLGKTGVIKADGSPKNSRTGTPLTQLWHVMFDDTFELELFHETELEKIA